MYETTIKNCPFCGGRPDITGTRVAQVRCLDCGASGAMGHDVSTAVRHWNRRGGMGDTRVALVNPTVPIETFKLIERVRELADRLERGDLGTAEAAVVLLWSSGHRSVTVAELRVPANATAQIIAAAHAAATTRSPA